MKMAEMYPSVWLAKEDVPHPVSATIQQITREEINDNGAKRAKTILRFAGMKPMILNKGNALTLTALFGDDSNAWIGKTVEIFTDPTVQFQGKLIGGLRIRAVQNQFAGSAPAPVTNGRQVGIGARWDMSDGVTFWDGLTTEEVRQTILDSGAQFSRFRMKPAGAPLSQAKPVEQWGVGITEPTAAATNDRIPF